VSNTVRHLIRAMLPVGDDMRHVIHNFVEFFVYLTAFIVSGLLLINNLTGD